MALAWVATAPIYFGFIRAYNINHVVPDSVVETHGLEAEGLVERREVNDAGTPLHGVDPATQAELDAGLATKVDTTDPRLSNARAPLAHAVSHAPGGADPVTPAAIGALTQATADTRYLRQAGGTVSNDGSNTAITVRATAVGNANTAVVRVETTDATKRAFDYRLTNDAVSRVRFDASGSGGNGTVTFGDGTTADTNLYRAQADRLKTDDTFHAVSGVLVGAGTTPQFNVANTGELAWGDGTAARDVRLTRAGAGTLNVSGTLTVDGWFRGAGSDGRVGFYGTAPVVKPAVTGSRSDGTALASLLTALSSLGLLTNSTVA